MVKLHPNNCHIINFEFKVGKIDNLLKTFLTQFCNNQFCYKLIDGMVQKVCLKKETLNNIIEKNKDRVYNGLFYTTLYGIGFWAILSTKQDKETAKELTNFLNSKKIKYTNQWSDAGWVYRFIIRNKIEVHNQLLTEFTEIQ